MRYRPDIDGLRAIAVIAVLLYHSQLALPGGYVGVDVFFVISGYLITSIIVGSLEAGNFSFRTFWAKRVRRLTPALAAMTAATTLLACIVLTPEDLAKHGAAVGSQPLLLSNVFFWRSMQGGYFGDPPETRPLLHTWSLGVEEQFYLCFPLFLAFLYRWRGTRLLAPSLAIAGLLSLGLSVLLTPIKGVFSFFMLPTRAWEMILGGLLNYAPSLTSYTRLRKSLPVLGIAGIVGPLCLYTEETSFPGYQALLPCLATGALLWSGTVPCSFSRMLSSPILVAVGKISYSLYLWHWPVMSFANYLGQLDSTESKLLTLALSFLLGYASWRWIESPLRKGSSSRTSALVAWYAVYAGCSLILGGWLLQSGGLPWRLNEKAQQILASKNDRSRMLDSVDAVSASLPVEASPIGATERQIQFLLWGDSHAMSIAPIFHQLGNEYEIGGLQLSASSTPPIFAHWGFAKHHKAFATADYQARWSEAALKTIELHRIEVVYLCAYWSTYSDSTVTAGLEDTIRQLLELGCKVVVLEDIPAQRADVPRVLAMTWNLGLPHPQPTSPNSHYERNRVVRESLDGLAGRTELERLDPAPLILQLPHLALKGRSAYIDDDHLSDHGAKLLRGVFEPEFQKMSSK